MSEYQDLSLSPPEHISKVTGMFESLKGMVDVIFNVLKANALIAKATASGENLALLALKKTLDEIIEELEKLKGGTFSGILAHPYAYGIKAGYDRITDTMTLKPESALIQVREAFDDGGDPLAPDKVNNYGGFIVVGSAVGVESFMKIYDSFGKFFSMQDLLDLEEQIDERWEEKKEKKKPAVKLPSGIDFFGISQEEMFPAYTELLNGIQAFVEGIKSQVISSRGSIDDSIKFFDKKLKEAEAIVKKIKDFLDAFSIDLSGQNIRYKVFKIEDNTAETIKAELLQGMPADWKVSDYSLVLGIFAGSETIELIFELLSLD